MTTAEQVERWQQTIADHPRRWCPHCKQRRCWEQAEARAQLIAHGLPIPAPRTVDRPQPAAGGTTRRSA